MDYYYDEQIRRLILQVCRVFGGLTVMTGKGADGVAKVRQVPIRYAEMSRMVAHILTLNSENTMLYTPMMSVHITAINMSPDRRQTPDLVTTHLVDERKFDPTTKKYTGDIGDRYTLKRYMPVPYDFTFQLDIWTSNTQQKLQILEQIMMLFNPSLDFRTSNNVLDWTSLTYIEMLDNIVWTSKSMPVGTDDPIDVASMQFKVGYWINPPAQLSHRKAIETIITNIDGAKDIPLDDSDYEWENSKELTQIIITPGNHICRVNGNTLILLGSGGQEHDDDGNVYSWHDLLLHYSDFQEGNSQITVKRKFGDVSGVTGKISFNEDTPNILNWIPNQGDLPSDTLQPINAIIDPLENYPSQATGVFVNPPQIGDRYMIVNSIPPGTIQWNNFVADQSDIIEYTNTGWIISFDSSESNIQQVVTNSFSGKKLRWIPAEQTWELAVDGDYKPGTWKVSSVPQV